MEVFEKAFDWLADLSSKLPAINFKLYFIIVVAVIAAVGLIVALTLLGSRGFRLTKASRKITKYLSGVESVTDENLNDFTTQCFSAKAPQSLRDSWLQYLGVRFGYPSDIVSEQNVYNKEVKKVRDIRANVFIGIALILVAIFAFWGYGTLTSVEMGVVHCAGLLLSGIIYLIIVILSRSQAKKCLEAFDGMLEDLDAKVALQIETDYATDSSPLAELSAITDEIIARNTSKAIDVEEEKDDIEETPIEALIAQEENHVEQEPEQSTRSDDNEEVVQEEIADAAEETEQTENADEPVEKQAEQTEDVADENKSEEDVQEEQTDASDETVQEEIEEPVEEEVKESAEEDAQEPENDVAEEPVEEDVDEDAAAENEDADEPAEQSADDNAEEEQSDEEVVYVVDDEGHEDEEVVKPSKLVNLPNLVDYMLARNLPKAMKMQIAGVLIGAYKKYQSSPDDRKIIVGCLTKVMIDLQK